MSQCDCSHLIALLDCSEETERHPNYRGWPSLSSITPLGRYIDPAFLSCPLVSLPLSSASAVSWERITLVWKYIPLGPTWYSLCGGEDQPDGITQSYELVWGGRYRTTDHLPTGPPLLSAWAYLRICPTIFGLLNETQCIWEAAM